MNSKQIIAVLTALLSDKDSDTNIVTDSSTHPMVGRHCVIRTYSAGVHIGTVKAVNREEVHLIDALRLWSWKDGGLSLSAVANKGIKGGRVDVTGEVCLTNAIEIIPTTISAQQTYANFIEE